MKRQLFTSVMAVAVLALPMAVLAHPGGAVGAGPLGGGVRSGPIPSGPPATGPGFSTGPSSSASRIMERGVAEVPPESRASATGVQQGSMSAPQANAADRQGVRASATAPAGFATGTIVKDAGGATVGRVVGTATGSNGAAQVMIRIGDRTITEPASMLTMSGRYAVASLSKAQLRATAQEMNH